MIADVLAQDRARVAGMAALALIAALVEGFGILALVPVAALAVSPDAMDRVPLVGAALATFPAPRAMLLVSHRPQTLARYDRRLTSAGGKLLCEQCRGWP